MNRKMIFRVLGMIMFCLCGLLAVPTVVALLYGESVRHFLITIGVSALVGLIFTRFKPENEVIYAKEGFVIVGLGWIMLSLFGAIPFVLSGDIPSYVDAVFETASGLTTTGASIMQNVETLSRGCMFWRLFTHWIGGMGVLVFIMAVMPMSGNHSMHIMRAEVPGPTVGKLVPRVRETAKILYVIYIVMTFIEVIFLLCGGMSFYDAVLHAMATAGTGGFSTRADSIAYWNSAYVDTVIAVFMVLFGVNFNLYYLILIGRIKDALKSEELHWYLLIIVCATAAITAGIANTYGGILQGLRYAFFNVSTLISSTGFGNTDFTKWPEYCKWILVMIMFCGASAGSTGGGMKVSRIMMLIKSAVVDVKHITRPRSVYRVQIDGKSVDRDVLSATLSFSLVYFGLLLLFTFIVSFDGHDIATNFTAILSCLSNMGPGMGLVGPAGNYSIFSNLSKITMTFAMLLGRLEIFPLLVLFAPSTWKK